jgi:hypothetical protein
MLRPALLLSCLLFIGAADVVAPAVLPKRVIAPPATAPAGEQIAITHDGLKPMTLFVPAGYRVPADGRVGISIHVHTVNWFAIDEHLRRGLNEPLLVLDLGQGSDTYGKPFRDDPELLSTLFAQVEAKLRAHGGPADAKVVRIDVSSFSAGYGAVREWLQRERYVKLIRRLVLADSLYASWQEGAPTSRPSDAQMEPFFKFADRALDPANGQTFCVTHSSVRTGYASTVFTAAAIADHAKLTWADVAASQEPYSLYRRADKGNLHIWSYTGDDAQAHLTHVRHIAEVWKALDEAGAP